LSAKLLVISRPKLHIFLLDVPRGVLDEGAPGGASGNFQSRLVQYAYTAAVTASAALQKKENMKKKKKKEEEEEKKKKKKKKKARTTPRGWQPFPETCWGKLGIY
jgi:sRNA-binding protein